MKRVFIFVYLVEGTNLSFSFRPLIPDIVYMDNASLRKLANVMDLTRKWQSESCFQGRERTGLNQALVETARALGEILEAEFVGDEIEIIDEATVDKRVASGEYVGIDRESSGSVS